MGVHVAMKTRVMIYSKRAFPPEILNELERLGEISKTEALERALNYLLVELPEKNKSLWTRISYEVELVKFIKSKIPLERRRGKLGKWNPPKMSKTVFIELYVEETLSHTALSGRAVILERSTQGRSVKNV